MAIWLHRLWSNGSPVSRFSLVCPFISRNSFVRLGSWESVPLVENWRSKALTNFPELEFEITRNQGGPIGLWTDLHLALAGAYQTTPINDELIGRIYDFAAWCFRQPETGEVETDLSNAAAVGFIESLPLDQRVSDDLYRWLSVETFEGCESLFRHHLSEEKYRKLHTDFIQKKKGFTGPSHL